MNDGLWHHDSVQLAIAVEDFVKDGYFHGISGGKEGLILVYSIIYFIPYYLFNASSSEFTITLATIIFASLSSIILYLWLRLISGDDMPSFLTSVLFSISPIILIHTTYATSHGIDLFVIIGSFYLLFLSLINDSKKLGMISSILLGFSFFVRPSNVILIAPYFLIVFFKKDVLPNVNKNFSLSETASYIIPIFLIYLINLWMNKETIIDLAGYNKYLGLSDFTFMGIGHIVYTLSIIGLIFSLLGFFYLILKNKKLTYFLVIWFILMFMYHSNVLSYTSRFLITTLIPIFVFLSYGLLAIIKFNKYAAFIIIIVIMFLMINQAYPVLKFRHGYSGLKQYSLFVKENTEQNALIIMFGDDGPFLDYYAGRKIFPCNVYSQKGVDQALLKISQELSNDTPIYISESCIFQRSFYFQDMFYNSMFKLYNTTKIGSALYEDYHKNDLRILTGNSSLYRLNQN